MATSGVSSLSQTRDDLINEALELISKKDVNGTVSTAIVNSAARTLNYLIKHLQSRNYFIWKRTIATIIPEKGKSTYLLGPNGDHCTKSYTSTKINANATAGATSLTVLSILGIANLQFIGIELDNGNVHWTTVSGVPTGTTVVLLSGLPSLASVGRRVFAYTAKINRPLDISQIYRRSVESLYDTNMVFLNRYDYNDLSAKTLQGVGTQYYFQKSRVGSSTVRLNPAPSNMEYVYQIDIRETIEDFTIGTDETDFPQEWFMPLSYALAAYVAPKFGLAGTPEHIYLQGQADIMLEQAGALDRESYYQIEMEAQ